MSDIQNQIRALISKNRLEQALQELMDWSTTHKDSELQNGLATLQLRFERVKQQERLGILSYTDALKEQSFIAHSILDMVQRLEQKPERAILPGTAAGNKRKTILFLASNPSDEAKLQLEKEFLRISSSLQEGVIEYKLVVEWAVTPNKLQKAILKHKPNLIHFSGHGEGGDEHTGGIILNDLEGKGKLVPGKALENMFRIFSEKMKIEIVLLNSCYSEDQAKGISKYIPFVIGMNDEVDDDAAIEFSTGFYRGLAEEEDVNFAFDLAVNMIQLEGLEDDHVPILLKERGYKLTKTGSFIRVFTAKPFLFEIRKRLVPTFVGV